MKQIIFEKPFVLSMGPQRAGTSWLDRYLRHRDDVCLPGQVKEVFFFDRHYDKGPAFYKSHFKPEALHALVMEISTTSFDHADAPERVHEVFGDQLVMLCPLRHPVTRSYSLYQHYKRYGIVTGTLMEACKQKPQILDSSRYAAHLERWYTFFPKENIHFIFQEDLEENPNLYVQNLCSVLDIPYTDISDALLGKFNAGTTSHVHLLASLAQKGADWLRGHRLYFVINAAKKMGFKHLIFGKDKGNSEELSISDEEREWLMAQLEQEVDNLEQLIGQIPQWH